jgi:hypothetical protein
MFNFLDEDKTGTTGGTIVEMVKLIVEVTNGEGEMLLLLSEKFVPQTQTIVTRTQEQCYICKHKTRREKNSFFKIRGFRL